MPILPLSRDRAFLLVPLLVWVTASPADAQDRPPTPVIVSAVIERQVADKIALVGTVHPRRQSRMASEVAGQVVKRLREAGQRTRRGDAIFQLENNQVEANLLEALADVKLRSFEREKSLKLWRQDALAEQQLRRDEYELERARAKLQNLESQMSALTIRAPFAGHIVQTFTEIGEWIDRGDAIADLISIDTVRVYVDVPEKYIAQLALADTAQIFIDALGTTATVGHIVAILAQGRAESHTFPVVVEALNLKNRIRANMSARVHFAMPRDRPLVLVHKDALVNTPQGQIIYLAIDDKAVSRPLRAGQAYNGYVAVEGDIQPGDLAIVRGNERLRPNQAVSVLRKQQ